ncbi:hypothetical protein ANO11243_059680 [Dothideomycetidae sp. 11243]|nr:hypothetical protein ANO11243_059680 [fungal sp. No.11243]
MSDAEGVFPFDAGPLGRIEGLTVHSTKGRPALRYFGGLPYALPPTGPYRFRAPRELPAEYKYGTHANPGRFTGETAVCPQPPSRVPPNAALFDENCLQLNIWVPCSDPGPDGRWPVMIYFHGGFLQWGSANRSPRSMVPLLSDSAMRTIIVLPSYRLNALGFLAGKELAEEATKQGEPTGNMGFWDQRLAIEWVHRNIAHFGGHKDSITVGGYSAGGFSAFYQLAYELYRVPADKAVIKSLFMLSNGCGVQPKTVSDAQGQFDEFIHRLGIEADLSAEAKLSKLRQLPYQKLILALGKMKISEFRPVSEGKFVSQDLIQSINCGDFARRMRSRNVRLLMGECRDEHTVYRNWRTPDDSFSGLYTRLCAEYPAAVVDSLLSQYCGTSKALPSGIRDWQELFGRIYADMQVHCLERGFLDALFRGGMVPGKGVLRYRFDRRLGCVDATLPAEWGVTHSSDVPIWFWGQDLPKGLSDQEISWLKEWNADWAAFIEGKEVEWGTNTPKTMRRWRSDGSTDVWEDDQWERGLEVWRVVNGGPAQSRESRPTTET